MANNDSYFIFAGALYKQIDGVAMGSPLGPQLANAFFTLPQAKFAITLSTRLEYRPFYYFI